MRMWRGRDRESYIGGYDPEYEMPDPDRGPRDRYMSDAYRNNARDSRYAYRMNPDRFEQRWRDDREPRDFGGDVRDRHWFDRGYDRGFEHGLQAARDRDRDWARRESEVEDRERDWRRYY